MPTRDDFTELIDGYIRGTLSPSEKEAFFELFAQKDIHPELDEYLWQNYQVNIDTQVWPEEFLNRFSERMAKNILASSNARRSEDIYESSEKQAVEYSAPRPAHRVHFLRTAWFRYAAAIIIMIGSVAYFWIHTRNNQRSAAATAGSRLQNDIAPGGEKAILTLSDGTKIVLDSAANGNLARQGNAQVVKLFNGQIVYNTEGEPGENVVWNTMSTPAGGQYQVTLPDGTKVWLNAASSITYPTAFVGNDRPVKISGEVYFEVAKNKQKPFIVDVDGKSFVEVLGTSFNINSYADEENIKTTLLEGSVKVFNAKPGATSSSSDLTSSVILKPGQQAVIAASDRQLTVSNNVDMVQALAWKNGLFNFNGSDLKSVMRQLERWYDIKVEYEKPVSNDIFKGEMYRNVNLSDVLDMLHEMDVKFRMEGKTLIVTG